MSPAFKYTFRGVFSRGIITVCRIAHGISGVAHFGNFLFSERNILLHNNVELLCYYIIRNSAAHIHVMTIGAPSCKILRSPESVQKCRYNSRQFWKMVLTDCLPLVTQRANESFVLQILIGLFTV